MTSNTKRHIAIFCAISSMVASPAHALSFTDQTEFLSELDTFTLIDTSEFLDETTFEINPLLSTGAFFGPDALVRNDDLILNGSGFHGSATPHVGINFNGIVNAVGVTSNAIDGGRIQLFSEAGGNGTLLEEIGFGGEQDDSFMGFIGAFEARSVIFTCDFNSDLRCGLRDPIFGFDNDAIEPVAAVPLPAAFPLFIGALSFLGLLGWRRQRA